MSKYKQNYKHYLEIFFKENSFNWFSYDEEENILLFNDIFDELSKNSIHEETQKIIAFLMTCECEFSVHDNGNITFKNSSLDMSRLILKN